MIQRAENSARRPRPADRPRFRPGPWLALYSAALAVRVIYAWLAGWLAAAHPLLVRFCCDLLPETTFTALMLVAFTASAAWVKAPRPGRALGVGLTWGVASLARPAALLLPVVVAAWAWVPVGLT